MNLRILLAAFCGVLFFTPEALHAGQRALLVGVGDYSDEKIPDLPGIDLDLARMTDTLKVMGFEESEIRTLFNDQSTSENILHEMNTWLVDGVGPDDRVVFYYSGHGSNIPDEDGDEVDDESDEVLVAHNAHRIVLNGKASLAGVVTDDQIAAAIKRSPSRYYMTVVDACHSGTVTRNLFLSNRSLSGDEVFEKTFVYDGMPLTLGTTSYTRDMPAAVADDTSETFVSISAAGDGEKAIGTSRGGVFTIGFSDAVKNGAKSNRPINLFQARDEAERYIRSRIDEDRVHVPQITGSETLAAASLGVLPLAGGNGPMWQRLEELVGEGQYFHLKASKPSYVVGEAVTFELDVKEAGYLNVVTVDAEDTATVLFPNVRDDNNYVMPGNFTFPTGKSRFEFIAAPPLGPTLVLAFVSENPVNLRELGYEGRLPSGEFDPQAVFTNVTHSATRAIQLALLPEEPEMVADDGSAAAPAVGINVTLPAPSTSAAVGAAATAAGAVVTTAAAAVAAAAQVADALDDDENNQPEPETITYPDDDAVTSMDEDEKPWLYASSLEVAVKEK